MPFRRILNNFIQPAAIIYLFIVFGVLTIVALVLTALYMLGVITVDNQGLRLLRGFLFPIVATWAAIALHVFRSIFPK